MSLTVETVIESKALSFTNAYAVGRTRPGDTLEKQRSRSSRIHHRRLLMTELVAGG